MNETQVFYIVVASVVFLVAAVAAVVVVIQRSSQNRSVHSTPRDRKEMQPPPDLRIPTGMWDSGQTGMYPPEPVAYPKPAPSAPDPVRAHMPIEDQLRFEIQALRNMGIAPKSELYRNPRSSECYVKVELPELEEFPHSQHELHVFISTQYPEKGSDWFLVRKYFDRYGEWAEHCLSCTKFTGSMEQTGSHPKLNDYGEYIGSARDPVMSISGLLEHVLNDLASAQPDPSLNLPHERAKSYTERIP